MRLVSPHDNLRGLRVPVFLLHGAGDTVIPASETLWLAHDAPDGCVQNALVSPAVVHVELEGKPSAKDQWDLVHFMAQIIEQAELETPRY
jgi:pimeloyl-ACP methyl ester carboxylesterase